MLSNEFRFNRKVLGFSFRFPSQGLQAIFRFHRWILGFSSFGFIIEISKHITVSSQGFRVYVFRSHRKSFDLYFGFIAGFSMGACFSVSSPGFEARVGFIAGFRFGFEFRSRVAEVNGPTAGFSSLTSVSKQGFGM